MGTLKQSSHYLRPPDSHKYIRCYLIEALGIDEDAAEQDACTIEHVLSNKTLCSMCRQTGKDICSEDCYLKIESKLWKA